jgi:MarR family transcriptional regulator, organic hydroperoxide resistance regulator
MVTLLAIDAGCDRGADIAKFIGVDAAAVTRLLDRLSDSEWIGRCDYEGDRRSRRITLSSKALEKLPRLRRIASQLEARLEEGLSAAEKRGLMDQLKALCVRAEKL